MFGCNTHLLKHIKQAILVWSFRQNIFLGCCPVFEAISAPDEFIVLHTFICKGWCLTCIEKMVFKFALSF